MITDTLSTSKVTAAHRAKIAYVYIRQPSLGQVVTEVVVIDTDLGLSGASAANREGFQKLVTEVGMGRAGIVLGLEVSRLAQNSADWHRLLGICALRDTLILDEDGIYDPAQFNDRLLLGLKVMVETGAAVRPGKGRPYFKV